MKEGRAYFAAWLDKLGWTWPTADDASVLAWNTVDTGRGGIIDVDTVMDQDVILVCWRGEELVLLVVLDTISSSESDTSSRSRRRRRSPKLL